MRIAFICLLSMLIFSCKDQQLEDVNFDIELFAKEWANSYEEESDSVLIYRPIDSYDFPGTFYRHFYLFEPDGDAFTLIPGDNDLHYYSKRLWQFNEQQNLLIVSDSSRANDIAFRILHLDPDLLKLVRLSIVR